MPVEPLAWGRCPGCGRRVPVVLLANVARQCYFAWAVHRVDGTACEWSEDAGVCAFSELGLREGMVRALGLNPDVPRLVVALVGR